MYRITYGDSVVFDPYDNDLSVTNAKMSAEINAASYLDFTISMRHPLYNTIREHDQVVGLYFDGATLFLGVVDSIETDLQGSKSISCVSALDYLNDTVVRPYSTISGDGTLTAPTSIDGYFQWLIDQHNAHVMDLQKRFEIGVNQGGSLSRTNYITPSSNNYPTTADEIMSNMLDAYGGYLTMRYDGDRKILDLYSDVHDMNPQIVDFGVNITDFTKTVSTESQYTALIPLGGSPSMDDGGFESGSYSEWVEHPDTPLVGSPVHQGSNSSYFTSGSGEYINKVCFYVKKGARYKATVWVKNERSSDVTVRFGYQLNTNDIWSNHNVANASMAVSNDGEWKEFSVDFMPDASENVGMRPRWYFDSVSEDSGKRVYVDDFDFRQVNGDSDVDEDPISLKLIPDGIAPRNSDVAIEGESIYSIDAVREYGYREKTWSDDSITDVDALLESAIVQLNKSRNPEISVDVKAVDLALYMDGYDHLRIGQAVRVRSKIHGIDEYLMVSSIDLDLQDPGQTDYTLGISYDTFTGQQSSYLRMLNGGINSSLDQVTALDQTTKDQAIQIGSVEQVANQAQQTANNAQNTANNAQNTANSNKEAIDSIKDAQTEYDKQLEQMQAGVEQAEQEISGINKRLDQMDTEAGEVQASIDAVRQEAQTNFKTAKAAADAAQAEADAVGADLESFRTETSESIQNVKDSVSDVQSDVDAVTQKASDLASELDGTKTTVEQVTTDLGEVKTTVSNAATKADQALQVSTSASQTATEAQTTATSAYRDAQSALTQSSVASQTANAVKTELETKYSTTDEIAEQYATKSLVEQTSQSITSTVEATYATKVTVEALENIANNAVQTWMGSGVPTLSNKPASDWTTAELKSQHSGDIYYDTDTGYSYRFGSSDGRNYSWSLIKDTDISKAVADAAKAQQTAEGVSDEVTQLKTDIPATYATKTEFKQTTDSIKSSVSEVATTANSALSKATTVEQTAKGLQTTVTEQAEKLDGAVTTISQVSQRVDSVSSTITQVSGRVDDVEDKADAAQGTANSALSQSSRVEQSLDSFKTSVSRDYQTKTEALSQKSELEQNINSFKTTVSETYTTKDEFNALEIGGTNLIKGSKPYGKSGFFEHFNSVTDNEYGELTLQSTTTSLSYPNVSLDYSDTFTFDKTDIVTGDKYVISYDVMMLERTYTASSTFTENWIGIRHNGGNWSGIIQYKGIKEDFLHAPLNKWAHFEHSITANAWDGTTNIGSNIQLGTKSVGKFRFRMRNVKLEKGTKATAWSPAPEDFDGKYTSKTEFKQTTDKISATATAASQNASSALSKISSLEVSVDGIDTRVEEVASDADEAVKTASQVSQRVDSLSSTITQVSKLATGALAQQYLTNPDFETGDTTGWDFQGFANVVVNNAGPNTGTYKVYVQPDGSSAQYIFNNKAFPVSPGQRYRISLSMNIDTASTHPMNFGLVKAGYTALSDSVYFTKTPSGIGYGKYEIVSGTVTIPSGWTKAQFRFSTQDQSYTTMRMDSFQIIDVSEGMAATDTANSALSKSSSVEQNLNSFKTSVSQTYETKSDALSKQSSLQQSVNNLRTEVSETYTTKDEFDNLQIGGTNLLQKTNQGVTGWAGSTRGGKVTINKVTSPTKLVDYPQIVFDDIGSAWKIATYGGGSLDLARQTVASSPGQQFTLSFDAACGTNSVGRNVGVYFIESDGSDRLMEFGSFSIPKRETWYHYELTGTVPNTNPGPKNQEIYFQLESFITANGDYLKVCNLKLEKGNKATEWSPSPDDMLSSDQAAQTYSTKSYVDQTARTVSLGVVEEYKNGQHGSALATASDITAAKDSITSTVSKTYLSKTDATNTYLNKNTAASTYATKTEVKQTSDSLTVTISSAVSKAESAAEAAADAQNTANSAKKQRYNTVNASSGTTGYFRFATLKITGSYANRPIYFSLSNRGQKASNVWVQFNNVKSTDPSLNYIQADGGMNVWIHKTATSTWEMIAQKSEEYDTLIVDDYSNANSITVTWVNGFLSSIPSGSTQATRLASKRPSSDIDNAQSAANTANSNAQNAQNRVGNLETCIKMTSDGVRVGKISNGNFTGYSALVNSNGSFDVLDSKGNAIVRFGSVTVSGASKVTTTIGNIESDSLAFNGSPVNGSFITFIPEHYNSGREEWWQHLPRDGSQSMAFVDTIHDPNAYSQFMELESSTKRCFRCMFTGWYLVGGIVELEQQTGANARIEGRWMLSTSVNGPWNLTSYIPDFTLLHEVDDYSYDETDRWHRITLPTQFVKLTKNQLIKYQLRITLDYGGEHAPDIVVGTRTYLNFFKLPFNTI